MTPRVPPVWENWVTHETLGVPSVKLIAVVDVVEAVKVSEVAHPRQVLAVGAAGVIVRALPPPLPLPGPDPTV
jgi:hypothetical protein